MIRDHATYRGLRTGETTVSVLSWLPGGAPRESEKPKRKPRTAYHDAPKARTAEPHQRANMTLTVRKCVRERIRVARATTTLHVRTTRSNRTKVQRSTLHQFLGEVWVNETG